MIANPTTNIFTGMGKYIAKLSKTAPFLKGPREVISSLSEGETCSDMDVYKQSGQVPAGLDFTPWEEIGSPSQLCVKSGTVQVKRAWEIH